MKMYVLEKKYSHEVFGCQLAFFLFYFNAYEILFIRFTVIALLYIDENISLNTKIIYRF